MASFFISVDGTCDLPQDMINSFKDYVIIPQDFTIAGKTYAYFGKDCLPRDQFYKLIDSGELAATSQVIPDRFETYWTPILEAGNDILHISFAAALSGSYKNSVIVARDLMEKFPDRKIITIDSANATGGVGLISKYAVEKRDSGADIQATADYITESKDYFHTYFTLDSLKHLLRMGRLSRTYAALGNSLQIKPIIAITLAGELKPYDKCIGHKNSLKRLIQTYIDKRDVGDNNVYIGHSGNFGDVEFLTNKVKEINPDACIVSDYVGAIAGSHTGSGVTVLGFKGKVKCPDIK